MVSLLSENKKKKETGDYIHPVVVQVVVHPIDEHWHGFVFSGRTYNNLSREKAGFGAVWRVCVRVRVKREIYFLSSIAAKVCACFLCSAKTAAAQKTN